MSHLVLKGLDILVVEDQYFVAMELCRVLEQLGACVVGPVGRLPLDRFTADHAIDIALLDVAHPGGTSFSLADEMARRGVPVALITGYAAEALPPPYRQLPRVDKPIEPAKLQVAVLQLTGRHQGPAA